MPQPSREHLFGKKLSRLGPLPNDGYSLLPTSSSSGVGVGRKSREKMVLRTPPRTKYFYNILFLIALSLILYLFSSQLLSQQQNSSGGSGGGGGGGEGSGSNSNTIYGRGGGDTASFRNTTSDSSLSNDFNFQKTGQLSLQPAGVTGDPNDNNGGGRKGSVINIDDDGDDNNSVMQQPFRMSTVSSGTTTGNTEDARSSQQRAKDWMKMFSETAHKLYAMFSPDYLKEFRKWAVKQQRGAIEREMKGYKFQTGKTTKLSDLVMEKGGQPIRNVIFTTWRSGSTFLGETLDSHPGTFYHYEPLLHFEIKQVRSGEMAKEGLRVLNQLLSCNYTGLNDYMAYGKSHQWLFSHNTRVWQYCEKSYDVCWDAKFLSDMCKMFPFQSVKTVRMRLRLAKTLLENKKLNIRLLLLVRDPRGTMQSRNHRDWCPQDPDCYDPSKLCMDMVDDFNSAERLRQEYPDRFLTIRYEDMSLTPFESMQKIFKFFRLQYHPQVEKFLSSHTKSNVGGVSSTFRDSKTTPFHWRNDFVGNFSQVTSIQNQCDAAMKLWGYQTVVDQDQLLKFNPLQRPPWPEMLVLNSTEAHDQMYGHPAQETKE